MGKYLFWSSAVLAAVLAIFAIYNAVNGNVLFAALDAAFVVLNAHTMYQNREEA